MNEPTNPEQFYIYRGKATINGIEGKAKIKKWIDEDTGDLIEKVLSFDAYIQGE